jgi:hypothetical protein
MKVLWRKEARELEGSATILVKERVNEDNVKIPTTKRDNPLFQVYKKMGGHQ